MAALNFEPNTLYEMDNLDVLRGMNSETIDLIATDPPFNTRRNRSGSAGFYEDDWKWGDTSVRPEQWKWTDVHPQWLDDIRDANKELVEVIEATRSVHGEGTAAFLCFLSVRLLEMERVLKPTGSIYLHCDHTANAYIRMAMDAIFGAKNFRNEIVWAYTGPGSPKMRQFNRKHDTLFWYSKGATWTFNRDDVREPHKKPIGAGGTSAAWANSQEEHDNLAERYKAGKVPEDWWPHFSPVGRIRSELTGSPDQKPLALYERIIKASSNARDIVLDPFAGCATTIIAARNLGRQWVGIDRRTDARFHVVCRMMGMTAKDAQKIRDTRPDLNEWLDERLASYDAHYLKEPPVRTDDKETAATPLPVVYVRRKPASLPRAEMVRILTERFGVVCWGCGFEPPRARYLELDHILPQSEGGSNELPNRALLCTVCNGDKSNTMTLTALRRKNKRAGDWHGTTPIDKRIDLKSTRIWAEQYMANRVTN